MLFLAYSSPAQTDSVSLEWRLGGGYAIARYHPDGGFGSPYTWSAIVERTPDGACIMGGGGSAPFRPRMLTLLQQELDESGITNVHFERRNRHAPRLVTVKRRA